MITTWKHYEISSMRYGNKPATRNKENRNNYVVSIFNTKTGKRIQFEYWMSIARPKMTTRMDLLEAVSCFLSDAHAGTMDYSEFCHEFGYEEWGEYGRNAQSDRIWKACKRAYDKFDMVFDADADICDTINEFQEFMESKDKQYV